MNRKTKAILVVGILVFLLLASATLAKKKEEAKEEEQGVGWQFLDSFKCIIFECGWPAIVILILPAIAIWIFKKWFAWG